MSNLNKIKNRVQKLLNQAADREGTPEGDVFYQKAFDLMAQYGFEERDLSGEDPSVLRERFVFDGTYTDMQARLLLGIATALHCVGYTEGRKNSSKVSAVTIFGAPQHLRRVEMLYSLLRVQMLSAASGLARSGNETVGPVKQRRSFMIGFAVAVFERLSVAEEKISFDHRSYELVLIDDRQKAQKAFDEYLREQRMLVSKRRMSNVIDGESYGLGVAAGKRSDIGQSRVRGRAALPGA